MTATLSRYHSTNLETVALVLIRPPNRSNSIQLSHSYWWTLVEFGLWCDIPYFVSRFHCIHFNKLRHFVDESHKVLCPQIFECPLSNIWLAGFSDCVGYHLFYSSDKSRNTHVSDYCHNLAILHIFHLRKRIYLLRSFFPLTMYSLCAMQSAILHDIPLQCLLQTC